MTPSSVLPQAALMFAFKGSGASNRLRRGGGGPAPWVQGPAHNRPGVLPTMVLSPAVRTWNLSSPISFERRVQKANHAASAGWEIWAVTEIKLTIRERAPQPSACQLRQGADIVSRSAVGPSGQCQGWPATGDRAIVQLLAYSCRHAVRPGFSNRGSFGKFFDSPLFDPPEAWSTPLGRPSSRQKHRGPWRAGTVKG
jgi:hypothetical protein